MRGLAEKSFLLELLQRESVGIIPEGVAGVTEGATPDLERLYILNRKGFVRVAIQAGAGERPISCLCLNCIPAIFTTSATPLSVQSSELSRESMLWSVVLSIGVP